MAEVFCNSIEAAGYWAGIYANVYWFDNKLTDNRFDNWVKWVAQYSSTCTYTGQYGMWQYANDGKVSGINGNVDMNYCYVDYPGLIRGKEEIKVDYIIQYSNSVDQAIAEVMADRLNCPTINCLRPYAYYNMYENVIAVGEARGRSRYTNVLLQGKDRKETLNKAIAYCESLGR
jgi:hypothetical protein